MHDGRELEDGLQGVREKAKRLAEDLVEDEAVDILEDAVAEVERFGEKLEESGS
jgi:hypothetical protein